MVNFRRVALGLSMMAVLVVCRCTSGQDTPTLVAKIQEHVDALGEYHVELDLHGSFESNRFPAGNVIDVRSDDGTHRAIKVRESGETETEYWKTPNGRAAIAPPFSYYSFIHPTVSNIPILDFILDADADKRVSVRETNEQKIEVMVQPLSSIEKNALAGGYGAALTVCPSKGYAIERLVVTGLRRSRLEIKTDLEIHHTELKPGIWVPTEIKRTAFNVENGRVVGAAITTEFAVDVANSRWAAKGDDIEAPSGPSKREIAVRRPGTLETSDGGKMWSSGLRLEAEVVDKKSWKPLLFAINLVIVAVLIIIVVRRRS